MRAIAATAVLVSPMARPVTIAGPQPCALIAGVTNNAGRLWK